MTSKKMTLKDLESLASKSRNKADTMTAWRKNLIERKHADATTWSDFWNRLTADDKEKMLGVKSPANQIKKMKREFNRFHGLTVESEETEETEETEE